MALEPWEIKIEDGRKQDSIATFIIFCEDGYHEPAYFRSFEIEGSLKINAIPRQGQSVVNFFNAVKYCKEQGLVKPADGVDKLKDGVTENIWCVYDRDDNRNQPNIKDREDFEFNNAIKSAIDAGLKVAWSNDSFELWVLLHFEQINADVRMHRNDIYDRLTQVFHSLPGAEHNLSGLIATDNFYYRRHIKPSFSNIVMPLLKERINAGLENAKSLESLYPHNIPYHDRNPCTMVHHLVKELLAYHNE